MEKDLTAFKKWCDSLMMFDENGEYRYQCYDRYDCITPSLLEEVITDAPTSYMTCKEYLIDKFYNDFDCGCGTRETAEQFRDEWFHDERMRSDFAELDPLEAREMLQEIEYDGIVFDDYVDGIIRNTPTVSVNLFFNKGDSYWDNNLPKFAIQLMDKPKVFYSNVDNPLYELIVSQGYHPKCVSQVFNGKETDSVFLRTMADELEEMWTDLPYPYLLTGFIKMDVRDLFTLVDNWGNDSVWDQFTFKTDSTLGLTLPHTDGTCSNMDITLEKPFTVDLNSICALQVEGFDREKGFTIYGWDNQRKFEPHSVGWYTIDEICGMVDEFWSRNKWQFD
jgi:hypothetical protein